MAASSAPTNERGTTYERGSAPVTGLAGLAAWGAFTGSSEYVPELQWPDSVLVYDRMLADSQVSSLVRSVALPLQRRAWALDPNGADPESVRRLGDELGLPIIGEDTGPRRRRRGRFSFKRHIVDAMRAVSYGYYFFEQVGVIEANQWKLRKLAPRPPRTISEINVAEDGGLVSIKQSTGYNAPELPVDRLVAYVWDQEAGNWVGRSMLRPLYRNWLIKDRLLRIDAIKHERGATGAPVIEAQPGATPEQIAELKEMAQAMRLHETGGGAIPAGAKLAGSVGPSSGDTINSVRYHDEAMAGAFLAMFKQLGQTQTGSRALGETFVDFFSLALDAVGEWLADTFNEHVIEDWYDWNYGEEAQAALLVVEEEPDPAEDIRPMQQEVENGNLEVSEEDAAQIGAPATASSPTATRRLGGRRRRRSSGESQAAVSAESPSLSLPPRALRRQPYGHEVQAAVDFAGMDATLNEHIDSAVEKIGRFRDEQVDDLVDQVAAAKGDMVKLAQVRAEPIAAGAILDSMRSAAQYGIDSAADEAKAQGIKTVRKTNIAEIEGLLDMRAKATDMYLANTLSDSAARQAIRIGGQGLEPEAMAKQVGDTLRSMSTSSIKDQMNGALTQAMNDGRRNTIKRNSPKRVYASELLDANTCSACIEVDGREYSSVDDTTEDYPNGGYIECQGMERCRGTLVAVYDES